MGSFDECDQELLISILTLLPSRDAAKCSMVCRKWRSATHTLNASSFWFRSAMSQRDRVQDAMTEVLEDVMAAPFWPNFAIIFAGAAVNLAIVSQIVKARLPRNLCLIACKGVGVVGKDVATGLFDEDATDEILDRWTPHAISLSVGRFPGVRVKALGMRMGLHFGHHSGEYDDQQLDTFITAAKSLQGQHPIAMLLLIHPSLLRSPLKKLREKLETVYERESVVGACVFVTNHSNLDLLVHARRQSAKNPLAASSSSHQANTNRRIALAERGTLPAYIPICQLRVLEYHDVNAEDKKCNVAALAFSKDCMGDGFAANNLKCAVVASRLRTSDLVAVGPVYGARNMIELNHPVDNKRCVHVSCNLDGEPAPLTSILRELGSLTHVSPIKGGQEEKKHFEFESVEENDDILRVKNCSRIEFGDFLQFYAPESSVAIKLMERALSSFALTDQRAKILAGLMFSTVKYPSCKQIIYAGRNLFNQHFPDVPITGLTAHHIYGAPTFTFVTCDENPAGSFVCLSELKDVICSIMFFILYTE